MKHSLELTRYYTLLTGRTALSITLLAVITLLSWLAIVEDVARSLRTTVLEWEPVRPSNRKRSTDEYTNPDNYGV
jgi:hypothetical protein